MQWKRVIKKACKTLELLSLCRYIKNGQFNCVSMISKTGNELENQKLSMRVISCHCFAKKTVKNTKVRNDALDVILYIVQLLQVFPIQDFRGKTLPYPFFSSLCLEWGKKKKNFQSLHPLHQKRKGGIRPPKLSYLFWCDPKHQHSYLIMA